MSAAIGQAQASRLAANEVEHRASGAGGCATVRDPAVAHAERLRDRADELDERRVLCGSCDCLLPTLCVCTDVA